WVMWPLLGLSVVAVTLSLERAWFFVSQNHPGKLRRVAEMARLLRAGERTGAREMAAHGRGAMVRGVCEEVVVRMLDEPRLTEASAIDAVEAQCRRMKRFMETLSTIVTAAPMLGILGTV